MRKVIYYKDEKNDDFCFAQVKPKDVVTEKFKYTSWHPLWHLFSVVLYWLIAKPFAYLFCRFAFHIKIRNKKAFKGYRTKGYFMYGNHTQTVADAFIPNIIQMTKTNYVVTSPSAVSVPGIRNLVLMLRAVPIPSRVTAMRKFIARLDQVYKKRASIAIYPEKHVWPYYIGIRNFDAVSFRYPIKYNCPVFSFTTTYKKRRGIFKNSRKPRIEVFVDGPFFPDTSLSEQERKAKLRDEVYNAMRSHEKENEVEFIQYIKLDNADTKKEINRS